MSALRTILLALCFGPAVMWAQPGDGSFDFTPTPSSGTVLGQLTLEGVPCEAEDWVAAFDADGVCAGSAQLIANGGAAYMVLTIYGDDATTSAVDEGLVSGGTFTLMLYDADADTVYTWNEGFGDPEISGWTASNGAYIPGLDDTDAVYDFVPMRWGCMDAGFLEFDAYANLSDGSCLSPVVFGCLDDSFTEFDALANTDDGSCATLVALGCTDDSFTEFDALANTDDGSCLTLVVPGCLDSSFTEFDALANTDDGSCATLVALGCTDNSFTEFDALANTDDGSCSTPVVLGCMDNSFTEFDALANTDDGSCATLVALGCTDNSFTEFDALANTDDGSCATLVALGCMDLNGCNFDAAANTPSDCTYPEPLRDCAGNCLADFDGDGVCDAEELAGCTYAAACNFAAAATDEDGSCLFIAPGECNCAGAQPDALGICGGQCSADLDGDGICDDTDPCVGTIDACGICNGPGEIYECGCADIPAGDCDCAGAQLDALGVCGGSCSADSDEDGVCDIDEVAGCSNPSACNYNALATDDDGSCLVLDALGICGGQCSADLDGDNVCDSNDPCVGSSDACGICNGPGEIYECGCETLPTGDCDCGGEVLDALGFCGGNCAIDADQDGICDDIDPCVGELDGCGICNGPGEIYDCGCAPVPIGACDCDGELFDACGVCDGGGISAGECNCAGDALDALGTCGGTCSADINANGICDDLEQSLCGSNTTWDPETATCVGSGGGSDSCPGDFNDDNAVGVADLLNFLGYFGNDCSE
jgi:hypothetical protein